MAGKRETSVMSDQRDRHPRDRGTAWGSDTGSEWNTGSVARAVHTTVQQM